MSEKPRTKLRRLAMKMSADAFDEGVADATKDDAARERKRAADSLRRLLKAIDEFTGAS